MSKKILILAANPLNTERLRLDKEREAIKNALRQAPPNAWQIEEAGAISASAFHEAVLRVKPNYVHFCGHGHGETGIVFEDSQGQSHLVEADTLAEFFKLFADDIECVILNACYSRVQAQAIVQHIRYVIGMKQGISDEAAVLFSTGFYRAIAAGESIERAYAVACNSLRMENISHNLTPELLDKAKIKEWVEIARRMERKQAYPEAIQQWQKIQTLNPQDTTIADEIERLEKKVSKNKLVDELKKQLFTYKLDIKPIYLEVTQWLKRLEKEGSVEEAEAMIEIATEFVNGRLTATDFIELWQHQGSSPKMGGNLPNYARLSERLRRGEIVIFLGSEVPAAFNPDLPSPETLLSQLAEYADYQGCSSFPEICEFLHINNQFGRNALRIKLQQLVKSPASVLSSLALYQLLASIPTPLVIISTCFSDLLEQIFLQQQRKFALLSHSIEEIGTLLVKYSDKNEAERYTTEELSGLNLLEHHYTLIYKILGCFDLNLPLDMTQKDSLMLSECDFFTFSRYADKLIPSYVVRQLSGRGFWLLGQSPRSWEKRLVVNSILKKRGNEDRPLTIYQGEDCFAEVYWEHHGVKAYPVDLGQFVENIKSCCQ